MDKVIEEALFDWIIEMRANNLKVTRSMIQGKARNLSTVKGFQASRGVLADEMMKPSTYDSDYSDSLPSDIDEEEETSQCLLLSVYYTALFSLQAVCTTHVQ